MFFQAAFAQQNGNPFGARLVVQVSNSVDQGQFFFSTNFHNANAAPFQRRQRTQQTRSSETENEELLRKFVQFIPLIIVFVLSIVSSWIFPTEPSNSNQQTDHLFSLNPSSKHRFPRSTRLKMSHTMRHQISRNISQN